jgi:hypothetical protein
MAPVCVVPFAGAIRPSADAVGVASAEGQSETDSSCIVSCTGLTPTILAPQLHVCYVGGKRGAILGDRECTVLTVSYPG